MLSSILKFLRQPPAYAAAIAGIAALSLIVFLLYLFLNSPAAKTTIPQAANQPQTVKILSGEEKLQLINSLASSSGNSSVGIKKPAGIASTTLTAEQKKQIIDKFNQDLNVLFPPAKRQLMREYIQSKTASASSH